MAWAELDPTCFAGTFSRYCANPSRVNECCGVCPVVPISYPGTVFAFAVGSFFNLFFALVFRTEAPYNLLLQFLSVDGALVSLVNSYFTSTNRLDLFSYCFVPLSICSCIPVAVAIALCRLEDLHVLSPAASAGLRAERRRVAGRASPRGEQESPEQRRARERPRSTRSDFVPWPGDELLPHRKLPGRILWFYFAHMVFFTIVFGVVYLSVKNTHQENCNDKYNLNTFWRPLMGGFAALNLVIGWLGCYILYQNIKTYYDEDSEHHRVTAWSGVFWSIAIVLLSSQSFSADSLICCISRHRLLKITRNEAWAKRRSEGYTREELVRCSIALSSFALWCGPYVTIWCKAAHDFNILGPNPWNFEQVGAATSVFIPFLICWRGIVDRKLQADERRMLESWYNDQRPLSRDGPSLDNSVPESHHVGSSHAHLNDDHQSIHRRESRRSRGSRRDSNSTVDGSITRHAQVANRYLRNRGSSQSLA